jgi:hypothetical protein
MKTKRFIFSVIALCCTMVAKAEENDLPVAILQHGSQVTLFKGINALVEAEAASVDGDVITLSAGEFYSANIQKSISLYGAGFEENAEKGTGITKILTKSYNPLCVVSDGGTLKNVHVEGVYAVGGIYLGKSWNNSYSSDVENITIKKCYVEGNIPVKNNATNIDISNCVVMGNISGTKDIVVTNFLVSNCYIKETVYTFSLSSSNVAIDHCIMLEGFYHGSYGSTEPKDYSPFFWTNCIFIKNSEYSYAVGHGSTVRNCICLSRNYSFSGVSGTHENIYVVQLADIFSDATDANYTAERTFVLKDPTTYRGTDRTPIGPSGGRLWNKVPATPVVKNVSVGVSGTQLNVSYEVDAR